MKREAMRKSLFRNVAIETKKKTLRNIPADYAAVCYLEESIYSILWKHWREETHRRKYQRREMAIENEEKS